MRITAAEVIPISLPFTDGGSGTGLMPNRWTRLQIALLKLTASDGTIGWGEGFAYAHLATTCTALQELVLPLVLDREIESIAGFNIELQRRLHLHGRYGITQFAISAVDIALWDIAAKQQGVSMAQMLCDTPRRSIDCYASLVRYGDPELVAGYTEKAVSEGYRTIKLHEITLPNIQAGRGAAPLPIQLTTDINCNWSEFEAAELMPRMREMDLFWVEEPLFPPDSEDDLAALQKQYEVSIASGENACTSIEFARIASAIDYLQPSVIKVGGISEFLRVCDLAESAGKTVMPHSPYFGPGYHATLQLMAARPVCKLFEYLYVEVETHLDESIPLPVNGQITPTTAPGHGFDPDPGVIERYRFA